MLHARLYTEVETYRQLHFDPEPGDRPLFAQLAGHDPDTVLAAARMLEHRHVDAIDLNFGCPQGIARKGRYGAFLLEEPDVMVALVERLAGGLSVPVTAKLRLLPSRDASIALCKRLEEAGASVVTLHGRTKEQNKQFCGRADWDAIRDVVQALDVPVIANGGIGTRADADACLAHTGAAAVMSSEALLENPALFCSNEDPASGGYLDQDELAKRYLDVCEEHPPSKGAAIVRGHLFKLLHHGWRTHPELRDELLLAQKLSQMRTITQQLRETQWEQPAFHSAHPNLGLSWYRRHRADEAATALGGQTTVAGTAGTAAAVAADTALVAAASAEGAEEGSREKVAEAALAKRAAKREAKRRRQRARKEHGGSRSERKQQGGVSSRRAALL